MGKFLCSNKLLRLRKVCGSRPGFPRSLRGRPAQASKTVSTPGKSEGVSWRAWARCFQQPAQAKRLSPAFKKKLRRERPKDVQHHAARSSLPPCNNSTLRPVETNASYTGKLRQRQTQTYRTTAATTLAICKPCHANPEVGLSKETTPCESQEPKSLSKSRRQGNVMYMARLSMYIGGAKVLKMHKGAEATHMQQDATREETSGIVSKTNYVLTCKGAQVESIGELLPKLESGVCGCLTVRPLHPRKEHLISSVAR